MASEQSPVEGYTSVIPLKDAGEDVFISENRPWDPPAEARGIFGGFLLAQSIRAGQETLPPAAEFSVHSLQSTFLRKGITDTKMRYHVDRVADGRTFATRLVRAMQDGECIFMAVLGFQKRGTASTDGNGNTSNVFPYELQMPNMDGKSPLELPAGYEGFQHRMGVPPAIVDALPMPFEWRSLPCEPAPGGDPTAFRARSFVRSPRISPGAPRVVHLAALAFLTDVWLLTVPHMATGVEYGKVAGGALGIQITLNHSVVFHDPGARADEWMVCLRTTEWAGEGRVLITKRLWNAESGKLLLSSSQEGLMRYARKQAKI
ncbi:acylthioesterase ii [Colletotrichum musicola]|uniref:Acylthioesterase ii n=1 Tax=Colletotrichum musicola TaxID=2175873 RepID=A0A8H6N021_9PEZI|nr:acylthioesterase ii [Colletotrichum musicola]